MSEPFTIKLVRIHGESWDEYAKRCHEIANLVLSHPPIGAEATSDFSDMSKYRKIDEHSYELELITRRQDADQKPTSERDTHFAGFARLVWDKLLAQRGYGWIDTDYADEDDRALYEKIITQCAYDLVFHHALVYLREGATIPDMTEWPKE